MSVDHWMMFGTFAEQRHFVYPEPGTYQGVVINANMAAHAPAGLAAFLLEKTANAPYIVDPLTHAFQHHPDFICNSSGEPKSAIRSLSEHYGGPIQELIGQKALRPKDLADDNVLREMTTRCVDFQLNHLKGYMEKNDAAKYLGDGDCLSPYAVVAPYFYLSETSYESWLPVIASSANHALENAPEGTKVFGSVVVSQGVLVSEDARNAIEQSLCNLGLHGFTLWVDNLDEQSASTIELESLLDLAKKLRGTDREVVNLHGGYFSILAAGSLGSDRYFSGVTHGPEFGEYRSVVPVGGGIPIARYYIPRLHSRVRYRDAQRIFNSMKWLESAQDFHDNVCNCHECRSVISGDIENFTLFGEGNIKSVRRKHGIVRIEFPTGDTKQRCLRHYLQRKAVEYDAASTVSSEKLLRELLASADLYEDAVGLEGVGHLRQWHKIFTGS